MVEVKDARSLSPEGQEVLRKRAVRVVLSGMKQTTAAQAFGVARGTVARWMREHRQGGEAALDQRPQRRPLAPKLKGLFCYTTSTSMNTIPAFVIGSWATHEVWINGQRITPAGFVRDLKAAEREPGDNWDILQECSGVRRFSWGDSSRATSCLALACCFYLKFSWVMDRFFTKELRCVSQADLRLAYTEDEFQAAYEYCEDLFAQEFEAFRKKLGTLPIDDE